MGLVLTSLGQMLSRHGARYPTEGVQTESFGKRIAEARGKFNATGQLEFLNDWKYELGSEILVPKGMEWALSAVRG